MSGPPQVGETEEIKEDWLVTYDDAITLLMAFFVLLYSVSEPNTEKFEAATSGIKETLTREAVVTPFQAIRENLNTTAVESDDASSMNSTTRGLNFELKSGKMLAAGSATLLPEAEPLLDRVAQMVSLFGVTNFSIEVEGHTDNIPINTAQFPSNWELSAARATAVVRFLISHGVDPSRLRAVGYADTKPKKPNFDESGAPIPENQETNRRVAIRIER
ncbi:MAG TPA: OmpA family protein [Alphaproteobacteria bacterium]|nr:OmpA family protein [Alphaproteobacteria bacterium]